MSVERLGTTEGANVPGMKVVPIISYALVHNGIVSLCGIPADPVGDVKVQTRHLGVDMTKTQPAVEVFAGIDVSAREIKVARIQCQEVNPTLATFANNASGHKALLAFLLQKTERVRACLEASGNYSLDPALAL